MALRTSDPEAVRAAARDILSQSQFADHDPTWWERAVYYVTHPIEVLTLVIDWIAGQFVGTGFGTVLAWIVVAIVIVGAIAMAVFLTRSTTHDNAVPVGFGPGTRVRTAVEFLAEAERFEEQGEWREAIRMRYASVLADAASQGVLRLRPGRTSGEYLADVRAGRPAWSKTFTAITEAFERAWYGEASSTAQDLASFKSLAMRLTESRVA